MTLYDELYFEINATGIKSDLKEFINFLLSGEMDDFFEIEPDFIDYGDDYATADPKQQITISISNDDYGIEIDKFYTDEFLELLCKAGKRLYLKGQLFDADNDEYSFVSEAGDSYYTNALLARGIDGDEDEDD